MPPISFLHRQSQPTLRCPVLALCCPWVPSAQCVLSCPRPLLCHMQRSVVSGASPLPAPSSSPSASPPSPGASSTVHSSLIHRLASAPIVTLYSLPARPHHLLRLLTHTATLCLHTQPVSHPLLLRCRPGAPVTSFCPARSDRPSRHLLKDRDAADSHEIHAVNRGHRYLDFLDQHSCTRVK